MLASQVLYQLFSGSSLFKNMPPLTGDTSNGKGYVFMMSITNGTFLFLPLEHPKKGKACFAFLLSRTSGYLWLSITCMRQSFMAYSAHLTVVLLWGVNKWNDEKTENTLLICDKRTSVCGAQRTRLHCMCTNKHMSNYFSFFKRT